MLPLRRMDGTELVCFLRQQFSPVKWNGFKAWNPGIPISKQVTSAEMKLDHAGICREG